MTKSKSKLPGMLIGVEWQGAEFPSMVLPGAEDHRITLHLWIELPSMELVGAAFGPADMSPSLAETLLTTIREPHTGRPRTPQRVCIEDSALAGEIRTALGPGIEVRVGPTPLIAEFRDRLIDGLVGEQASTDYLAAGNISPETMGQLFTAAQTLYVTAPWKTATDDCVLRVDIPDLDVQGACLSIIGNLGESFGFLLFPSFDGYLQFRNFLDFGTGWLALDFIPEEDLTPEQLDQVKKYGWPVSKSGGYPNPGRYDSFGESEIVEERDIEILGRCALALTSFAIRNGPAVFAPQAAPTSQSFSGEKGRTVRLTYPASADRLFDFDKPPDLRAQGKRIGRNDPCPCGSGRKFKQCCLQNKGEAGTDSEGDIASVHRMDRDLVDRIVEFSIPSFRNHYGECFDDFMDPGATMQLAGPYSVYCFSVDGERPVDLFLKEKGRNLAARERNWLVAQTESWLSVWEIEDVEPNVALAVVDLLTGERRRVFEKSGSGNARKRDCLLARVVDFEGYSVMCGSHLRPLPPESADAVLNRIRKHLRLKKVVTAARLRNYETNRRLLSYWEDEVEIMDRRMSQPPILKNTDGEPFLLSADRFRFNPGKRPQIRSRLAAMANVQAPEADSAPDEEYVFERRNAAGAVLPSTIIGTVRLESSRLVAETNSIKRADDLRAQLLAACGEYLNPPVREHSDPMSPQNLRGRTSHTEKDNIPADVKERVIREFKERHYANWIDQPIPALNGLTPREAAREKDSRHTLDVLLKSMEHREEQLPFGERTDIHALRAKLKM